MPKPDFAREFTTHAVQSGILDSSTASRLEAEMRSKYAGEVVKIAPRAPITLESINSELRQGKNVRTIANEMGCSRATLYRHLGANSRKSKA